MKAKVDYHEFLEPIDGMLEGIARKTYKEKKKSGVILPTCVVNDIAYEYIRVRNQKVVFNAVGTPLRIATKPITREQEVSENV